MTRVMALLLCVGLGLYNGQFEERLGFAAVGSVAGVTGVGRRRRRDAFAPGGGTLADVRSIAEVAQRRPVPLTAGPLRVRQRP